MAKPSRKPRTPRQPLAEVFGFPVDNFSSEAERHRKDRLCPYNNKIPNCTKVSTKNPLGACTMFEGGSPVIICPVRFRQDWLIASDAADFFFPPGTLWTSFPEVRLKDLHGESAGNIDLVLVSYDGSGRVLDFGAVEVQSVYISGNIRRPFTYYMADPEANQAMDWSGESLYPRADWLSSSRKRLAPQLIFKGGILHSWRRKQAVVVQKNFFETLPSLPQVSPEDAEVAWLLYDLILDSSTNLYHLRHEETVYTRFGSALSRITTSEPGDIRDFIKILQGKLNKRLGSKPSAGDTMSLFDLFDATDEVPEDEGEGEEEE